MTREPNNLAHGRTPLGNQAAGYEPSSARAQYPNTDFGVNSHYPPNFHTERPRMTSPAGQRDHQHDQQQKADRQRGDVDPAVHVLPRRNEVAVIAALAPRTIAYLPVPLTPARAARLAAFTARTGVDAQQLVVDLLDDVIFAREVVLSGGVVPCLEQYRSESQAIPKSPDANVGVPTKSSVDRNSTVLPKPYGQRTPPPSLPASLERTCEPPSAGCQASFHHPASSSPPSSSRSPSANREGCGND